MALKDMRFADLAQAQMDMYLALLTQLHDSGAVDASNVASHLEAIAAQRQEGVAAILASVVATCRTAIIEDGGRLN